MDSKKKSTTENNEEDEYMGNMWGWKFSLFGLGLMILLFGLMLVRKCQVEAETGEKIELFETSKE